MTHSGMSPRIKQNPDQEQKRPCRSSGTGVGTGPFSWQALMLHAIGTALKTDISFLTLRIQSKMHEDVDTIAQASSRGGLARIGSSWS